MRLLIIGSLDGHMTKAGQIAMARGADVTSAENIDIAMIKLRAGQGADLAIIDVKLPIQALVEQLEEERIYLPVVACGTEQTDAKTAVEAIESGAKDYIPLPPDPELIAAVIAAVTEESQAVIFQDQRTRQTLALAEKFAPSHASILITGESGTGKEVFARYIHKKSKRRDKPFVAINCAAIPENLLESELFGHEKGAFSGAIAKRIGKFEEANGGTLLLDEISEMDLRLQAKLLRVIQEKEIDRVGGSKTIKVDVRILATSNRNIMDYVREGHFREDLYFRLNVVHIQIPPLRERLGDIDVLSQHFQQKYAKTNGIKDRPFSDSALQMLKSHSWPGNVRELENTIHRAVLLGKGERIEQDAILLSDATYPSETMTESSPSAIKGTDPTQTSPATDTPPHRLGNAGVRSGAQSDNDVVSGADFQLRTLAEAEHDLLQNTLKHCLGNRTHAANILGISIRTLRNKLQQYGADNYE